MAIFYIAMFAVFVTLSHACALLFAKKHQSAYDYFKKERLWKIHIWVNGILWFALFVSVALIQFSLMSFSYPLWLKIFGIFLIILGAFLVIVARLLLGLDQAMGIR